MYCYKNTLKKQIMLQVIVLGLCDFEKFGTKEIKVWAYDGDMISVWLCDSVSHSQVCI